MGLVFTDFVFLFNSLVKLSCYVPILFNDTELKILSTKYDTASTFTNLEMEIKNESKEHMNENLEILWFISQKQIY